MVVIIFIIAFPTFYLSGDEHSYIKTANLISNGEVSEENIFYAAGSVNTNQGLIPNVAINFPIFLVPFVFLGVPLIFVFSLLIHLINISLFSVIISKLKISQKYVFLYAFFPALLWLSRTLYPQQIAITFLLLGFLLYVISDELKLKSKRIVLFISAFVFGFAVFVRPDSIVLLIFLFLVVLYKKRKDTVFFGLGFIAPAMLLFLVNFIFYGGIVSTAYGHSGLGLLARVFIGVSFFDLIIYALAAVIFYPLMLFSFLPRIKNKYTLELFALFFGGLILQIGLGSLIDTGFNPASFYFINFRYFSLGLPFILIAYAFFLDSFLSKKINRLLHKVKKTHLDYNTIFVLGIFVLVVLCFSFSFIHQGFTSDRLSVRAQVVGNTPEDALIIGSSDDKIYFIKDILGGRRYLNINLEQDIRGLDKNVADYFDEKTYFMQLTYSNRADLNSSRKINIIDVERAAINSFIQENAWRLELIFETNSPHNLRIYKLTN